MSVIYIEKYNATKKDRREYPLTKNSPLWCDIRIDILVANICITYRFPITQNLNGLDFDLSMLLGVNCIDGVGLPIHDFLFRFNSNT